MRTVRPFVRIVGSNSARDDLRLQGLELQLVEETGLGIAARRLPAHDHGVGSFVELAADFGIETKAGEAALYVATLALVEPELVFGRLVGLLGEGQGIDTRAEVTRRGRWAILQRRYAGKRQRLERAVRIVGEIGVKFFRLVGILHRS